MLLPAWPAKGPPPSEAGPPADGFLKHREKGHPLPGAGQNPARPAAASCVPPYGNPAPASGHLSVFSEIPRHVPLSSPPVMFNKFAFPHAFVPATSSGLVVKTSDKESILREVIHKWDNHISKEQKPFAGAGMGHIGKPVRGNPKSLCQNLSVPLSLVEHVDKIRVLENILNLTGSQKILYVLGRP